MRKFLLALMFLGITFMAFSQNREKGDLQIGIQGGASVPVDTYKSIGDTKLGYHAGFFIDKYFTGNKFGVGLDARTIYNSINTQDSFHFDKGFIATDYINQKRFQNFMVTLGPSYKYAINRFHVEAYVRGGVMLQQFPEYVKGLTYSSPGGGSVADVLDNTINDPSNKAYSWAGVGGLRFNYKLNDNFALFAHVDYVQTFGTDFAGKDSQFTIQKREMVRPIDPTSTVDGSGNYFGEPFVERTPHKTVNSGVGVKYIFGRKATPKVIKEEEEVVKVVRAKDLQIVVKDKQTGLALSGVTVSVIGTEVDEKSISDSNGQASRINNVKTGRYEVIGEKNGIETPLLVLTDADFQTNSSVILKEIYHDDPRFTLIGETFDCVSGHNLANINTVLTNTESKINSGQISDAEGKFIYQLDPKSEFSVVANQQGKYSQTELVSTKGLDRSQTLYVTLKMGVCELSKNGSWVLKNIHYDFDKHNIRTDAAVILDNVVSVLQQNPTLKIELSSHTDSRGNDDYNQKLSQRRADSAVAYLISKGISRSRLIAAGYGESRLLNNCGNGANCSEEQHQENRRTEIKVLEY